MSLPIRDFILDRIPPHLRRVLSIAVRGPERRWANQQYDEINFSDEWFRTQGLSWPDQFRKSLDREMPLQKYVADFLPAASETVHILDVGSGPLTVLGKRCAGKTLRITAVDPNAEHYAELFRKYEIAPLCPPMKGYAEELSRHFSSSSFDLVHARNSLDHSRDPLKAFNEIIAVLKPGHYAVLTHKISEGKVERYWGPHQWNFYPKDGQFWISRPGKLPVNISKRLAALAQIKAYVEPENHEWFLATMRKRW